MQGGNTLQRCKGQLATSIKGTSSRTESPSNAIVSIRCQYGCLDIYLHRATCSPNQSKSLLPHRPPDSLLEIPARRSLTKPLKFHRLFTFQTRPTCQYTT